MSHYFEEADSEMAPSERDWWTPPFSVTIALVILILSVLYALTFGHMVYDSLMEQVIAPNFNLPRYAGHIHYHNQVEWFLLVSPIVIGLVGIVGSLGFLTQRLMGGEEKRER